METNNEQAAAPTAAEQQKVVETYWHVVAFYGGNFADYQIAMTYPFFNIAEVRAAIENDVKSPTVLMSWRQLHPVEYAAAKQYIPQQQLESELAKQAETSAPAVVEEVTAPAVVAPAAPKKAVKAKKAKKK